MLCPNCKTPMLNVTGSEAGEWQDNYYLTLEIKICPVCEIEVKETYSAEIIKGREKVIIKEL